MLLEMLSRVAADVMPLQAEEQVRSCPDLGFLVFACLDVGLVQSM